MMNQDSTTVFSKNKISADKDIDVDQTSPLQMAKINPKGEIAIEMETPAPLWQRSFWALRSALFMLFMTLTVVPYASAILLTSVLFRGRLIYAMAKNWLSLSVWAARVFCGVCWRVQGQNHLPDFPVIVLSKHQSTWETFALPMLMPQPLAFVFKRELIFVPFFGWVLWRLEMIHIDRSSRHEAWSRIAEQGRELLAKGHWPILFPEGTRSARGAIQSKYKTGGARLAVETQTPVLPIAVTSARCWPRKSWVLRPGVIDVSIGAPIAVGNRSPNQLSQAVQSWIEAEMQRLDAQAYVKAPSLP
jgi:1-acyl-sn-glycerol-3-phosphate acyltransferase